MTPSGQTSGLDVASFDPAVRPQDDLYRHVNGRWIAEHVIPDDRAVDGAFRRLHDLSEERVHALIQECAERVAATESTDSARSADSSDSGDPAGSADSAGSAALDRQVGGLFASFMDVDRVEALGLEPLRADLALIDDAATTSELAAAIGRLQRTGAGGAIGFFVDTDSAQPGRYLVHLTQGGLGLPDESYYREDQYASVREAYLAHVARMLRLAGVADAADAAAGRLLALETRLASHHWDVVRDRDAEATYNLTTFAVLAADAPGFDWDAWLAALEAPGGAFDTLVVREPDFPRGFAALWASEPLEDWKLWATYHAISARAPYLPAEVVEANFDFYSRTLTGAQQLRERWRRGVSVVEGVLGEGVGRLYVERHFPPAHKARMVELVGNLVAAYRESIASLDWMGPATRERALAKLEQFTPKIGYPDRWKSYEGLVIDPADLLGNVRRAYAYEHDRELRKLGGPVDRGEWFMTPQTVNAYYNPGMNEIVFPAAILQPPFFDADADDAANYGGIGAVIGHEIGHGFDDQGSKYDGEGRLADWWTQEDRAEFEERAAALIAQYDALVPAQLAEVDGGVHHVNGGLTIGENIGDLGGLAIALAAYRIALGGAEAPVLDGLTGVQRVFAGWAATWQAKIRDEEAIRRLAIDPHSPNEFRCNAVVRNLDAFHDAFEVKPGDALWLAPEDRVRIW